MSVPGYPFAAHEQFVGTGSARLYVREIGHGVPIIVVHGGPDFDHEYLLPEMDGRGLKRMRSREQSERMSALVSDPRYQAGDIDADLEYDLIPHLEGCAAEPDRPT